MFHFRRIAANLTLVAAGVLWLAGTTAVAEPTATRIGMGIVGVRVDKLEQSDPVLAHGMSGYLLPFEIIAVHLLIVLIGAAYLARAKKRAAPTPLETAGE